MCASVRVCVCTRSVASLLQSQNRHTHTHTRASTRRDRAIGCCMNASLLLGQFADSVFRSTQKRIETVRYHIAHRTGTERQRKTEAKNKLNKHIERKNRLHWPLKLPKLNIVCGAFIMRNIVGTWNETWKREEKKITHKKNSLKFASFANIQNCVYRCVCARSSK